MIWPKHFKVVSGTINVGALRGMPRSIAELFRTSSRLGHSRVEPFRKFLSTIQDMLGDSDDDYYRYPELRSALDQVS
ncbi:hypothetical protein MTIM_16510 [Mycobacterium timonense]|uniref:Uncharacterized protein n=1 Tax=Mycobacterium timonense TaxID=701043 RepID=A0A7I9Z4I3_9MYCO|nr:hypothetical protein MTIM_16510 [Mycobacterium timonense]